MASADLSRADTATIEEFVALNDELAALIRSGLPLELGLGAGRGRRLGGRITERLRQGRSLDEALRDLGPEVPTAYRAVVEAGLKSGRLSDAVETISRTARVALALRRRLAVASIYPAIVAVIACALTAVLIPRLLAPLVAMIDDAHETPPRLLRDLLWLLRENPAGWLYWLPVAVLLILWAAGGLTAITMRLPGLKSTLDSYRLATFAELAAGLLEHGTPLDEALTLAADASGDGSLAADARRVSTQLRSGGDVSAALNDFRSLPRFAHWMITAGAAQSTLTATLRQVAEWAVRRGNARADWFSLVAPAALTLLVGGTAVVAFAAISFGPVIHLLYRLSSEISA